MTYATPPDHKTLRAFIELIDLGLEQKSEPSLRNIHTVLNGSADVTADEKLLITTTICGYMDLIRGGDYYNIHSKASVDGARDRLDRAAYGDFNEAMYFLEADLRGLDPTIPREILSDIFKPEYFSDDQRRLWHKLRKPVEDYVKNPTEDVYAEAVETSDELRNYQQSFYGPLLPTMSAGYISDNGTDGATVQLAYADPVLIVKAAGPLKEGIDVYFADHPVQSIEGFVESAVPRRIGGFTLTEIVSSRQFRYEIEA